MPVFSPLHTWEQHCPQYWILCQPELNPLVLDYPKRNNSLSDTYHLYDHPNPQTQRSQHRVVQFQLNTWCVRMLIIWIWLGTGLQTGGSLYEHLKTINYNSHFVAKILVKFQRHSSMRTVSFRPINERFGPDVQSMKHTVENCRGRSCWYLEYVSKHNEWQIKSEPH